MAALMVDVVIDSPRWREGWGEARREGWGEPLTAPRDDRPALRLVDSGSRRPHPVVVRRRRLVVVAALGVLLAIVLGVASMALARPATAGAQAEAPRTHLVQPGDTYWSIAERTHDGEGDLRLAVDRLIDANGARPLLPGDRIDLP